MDHERGAGAARSIALSFFALSVGCSAILGDRPEQPPVEAGLLIEDAVVTTAVDESLAPSGQQGLSFSARSSVLYLCFHVVEGELGETIIVRWQREGEALPLSTTSITVTGHRWMASAYEPISGFEPGAYVVRATAGEQALAEVSFTIFGEGRQPDDGPSQLQISSPRFIAELDESGRPRGASATIFPPHTTEVHAAFTLSGARAETRVEARWLYLGRRLESSYLGVPSGGGGELVSTFRPRERLAAGLYRLELAVDDNVVRSGTFTVEGEAPTSGSGPRVSNLILTTAADPAGRPTAPPITTVRGDLSVIYLTLTFAGMHEGDTLVVRWYQDTEAAEPLAEGTYQVSGRGSLAASFEPGDPLEPGSYHVDVTHRRRVLGTQSFTVE